MLDITEVRKMSDISDSWINNRKETSRLVKHNSGIELGPADLTNRINSLNVASFPYVFRRKGQTW